MRVCIQDPVKNANYVINEAELAKFAVDGDDDREVDVLLVASGDTLLQELPPSRLSDSDMPTVQIVDPDANRNWVIPFEALQRFSTPTPPSDSEDIRWFAMPLARNALAAVPVFRRALVQNSS